MTTGERIKKLRKQKGMTQKQLSEELGIANNSLSRYEIGERNPPFDMLEKIAAALGVQTWELLCDDVSKGLADVYVKTSIINNQETFEAYEDLKEVASEVANRLIDRNAENVEGIKYFYNKLNHEGKKEALKRTIELTKIEEYTKSDTAPESKGEDFE